LVELELWLPASSRTTLSRRREAAAQQGPSPGTGVAGPRACRWRGRQPEQVRLQGFQGAAWPLGGPF